MESKKENMVGAVGGRQEIGMICVSWRVSPFETPKHFPGAALEGKR